MPIIDVSGVDLYYEADGIGQPLLLLHGLGSSARDWELQVRAFARQYRVIAVDLRGHGRSEKAPGAYAITLFAKDVASLLERVETAPVDVVGLSMGGMVALELALRFPDRVRSLVVVNSSAGLNPRSLPEYWQVLKRVLLTLFLSPRQVGMILAKRFFPEAGQAPIRRLFVEHWAQNDKHAYLKAMWAVIRFNVVDELVKITCPTMIVSGELDYIPLRHKEQLERHISCAELVIIPDSRHGTPVDQAERFNAVLAAFLRRVDQAAVSSVGTAQGKQPQI